MAGEKEAKCFGRKWKKRKVKQGRVKERAGSSKRGSKRDWRSGLVRLRSLRIYKVLGKRSTSVKI
jgi:hypothetical protein